MAQSPTWEERRNGWKRGREWEDQSWVKEGGEGEADRGRRQRKSAKPFMNLLVQQGKDAAEHFTKIILCFQTCTEKPRQVCCRHKLWEITQGAVWTRWGLVICHLSYGFLSNPEVQDVQVSYVLAFKDVWIWWLPSLCTNNTYAIILIPTITFQILNNLQIPAKPIKNQLRSN